jgi:hypothetical protein
MADVDPTDTRSIGRAHSRLDDHERRLTAAEVRQEEMFRRLTRLDPVPEVLAEIKGDLKALAATLKGSEKTSGAASKGTAVFLDLLKALVLLVIGAAIRGGIGGP